MRWMVVLVCASVVGLVVGLVVVVARVRRNRRALQQMRALLTAGHHQQVLEHALPAKPLQDLARSLQVTSAVFTGRFLLALDLLAASTDDGTVAQTTGSAASAARLRAVSLLGLGRYGETARMVGDDPPMGPLRRVRAQAAIEVGDDDCAEALLADPCADPLEEAGRLRSLGDLCLRRGRLQEGERLVRTARASYAGSGVEGAQVDVAICTLHLAQARLAAGMAAAALPLVRAGLDGLQVRPDHQPGFVQTHALAARVHAALGNGPEAGRHLATAQEHASRCESPPLDAEVTRSTALVALELGDLDVGHRLLHEAIAAHEKLGAVPVVAELRSTLASLDA